VQCHAIVAFEREVETGMRPKELAALLLLAALWGSSFLFIRVAVPAFGPVVLATLRVALAGIGLLIYAAVIRHHIDLRGWWQASLVLGALNATIPYVLIATAELHLTASLAVILNATTPLFTAVVSALWLRDRLTAKQIFGLALGVIGVAVLVGWNPSPVSGLIILSVGASLMASLSYALAGVHAKRAFAGVPSLTVATAQQIGATILLLPFAMPVAVANRATIRPDTTMVAALVALALLSTSLGYLLYFFLIASIGPTKTLSVTFLMPVFGVFWGTLFLHDVVRAGTLAGLAIILASVCLVVGIPLGRPEATPDTVTSTPVVRPDPAGE
jgi:drug/metabolite transporter (DMT)-like permease